MQKEENYAQQYTENSLPERFDSWIKKVLENLVFNEVRSCARRKISQPEFFSEDIDNLAVFDPFGDEELIEILLGNTPVMLKDRKLAESLGKISKRKQQAIEGTIILGIPIKIVAEMLGIDEQIVRNYKNRGLDELRSMMEGSEHE